MDGLAMAIALAEISPRIVGGRIQAVKEPLPGVFVLSIRSAATHRLLLSPAWSAVHLTTHSFPGGESSSPFVMMLRKALRGARVERVEQRGLDRFVRLPLSGIDAHEGTTELVAELIGRLGNLILVRDDRVIACWRTNPRVRVQEPYRPLPVQEKRDPGDVTASALREILGSPDPTVQLCRTVDGIGRSTAERLLETHSEPEELHAALATLAEAARDDEPWFRAGGAIAAAFMPQVRGASLPSFSAALDVEHVDSHRTREEEGKRADVRRRIRHALRRRQRTVERIGRWIDEADPVALRQIADVVLSRATEIPRGAEHVELEDPITGEVIGIDLDPAVSAPAYAQRLYRRARRIERGAPRAQARLRRLSEEATVLREGLRTLDAGRALDDDVTRIIASPPATSRDARRGSGYVERIDGYTVRIGRSAVENDALLRRAKANDLWLHVHGASGAHVIVHRKGRDPIPQSVVRAAARLAVEHSKKRDEARAQVTVAEVRHVRKPKGAAAGLVRVTDADTLTVAPVDRRGTDDS
ncbi:MAG: NFACT family protein [Candidatus Bipolaricaulota bacterium]|nr:MAG: NFACT family protein [Candidatus Bipolaricaulota bacterium]